MVAAPLETALVIELARRDIPWNKVTPPQLDSITAIAGAKTAVKKANPNSVAIN